jgi:hypothetical protein
MYITVFVIVKSDHVNSQNIGVAAHYEYAKDLVREYISKYPEDQYRKISQVRWEGNNDKVIYIESWPEVATHYNVD